MILVIGGAYQGKKDWVQGRYRLEESDWTDGDSCSEEDLFRARAVNRFHLFVRRSVVEGRDLSDFADTLREKNPSLILVKNEIGCGVVPRDPLERKYREQDGRLSEKLAAHSDTVVRVICGIGQVIKGSGTADKYCSGIRKGPEG